MFCCKGYGQDNHFVLHHKLSPNAKTKQIEEMNYPEFYIYRDSIYTPRQILQQIEWQKFINKRNSIKAYYYTILTEQKLLKNDSIFNYCDIYWSDKYKDFTKSNTGFTFAIKEMKNHEVYDYTGKKFLSLSKDSKVSLNIVDRNSTDHNRPSFYFYWRDKKELKFDIDSLNYLKHKYGQKINFVSLGPNSKKIKRKYEFEFEKINDSLKSMLKEIHFVMGPNIMITNREAVLIYSSIPKLSDGTFYRNFRQVEIILDNLLKNNGLYLSELP